MDLQAIFRSHLALVLEYVSLSSQEPHQIGLRKTSKACQTSHISYFYV